VAIEFDPDKNAENIGKHGVPLSEADGVLNDPLARTVDDMSSEGEARSITIGTNVFGTLYVVVWTKRGANERVISVRKPVKKERIDYETKR
jgi:uncharacterized protein